MAARPFKSGSSNSAGEEKKGRGVGWAAMPVVRGEHAVGKRQMRGTECLPGSTMAGRRAAPHTHSHGPHPLTAPLLTHAAINAAGAQQRRVQNVRAVCG